MASRASIKSDLGRVFEFGSFRLDANERLLLRDGAAVSLTPKVFDTLLLLVENSGHLLEKDDLMRAVWPDSFVEEVNLNRSISTLRRALGEVPSEPKYIETIPKRGYRFIAAVTQRSIAGDSLNRPPTVDLIPSAGEVYATIPGALDRPTEPQSLAGSGEVEPRSLPVKSHRLVILAIVIAIAMTGLIFYAFKSSGSDKAAVAKAETVGSLAVLPFKTLSVTGKDDDLGLGITDVLITQLSNMREIVVRPTSAVLKYRDQDPIEAGRALKVDTVLEGSVQRVDERIRVTVRLMDVKKEVQLFGGSYTEPAADLLKVQDSIAERVTKTLSVELKSASYTQNVKAQELYLKGRFFFNQRDLNGIEKAELYFRQAIEEDPNYALAYTGLADLYTIHGDQGEWGDMVIQKALELDNTLGEAHASKGFRLLFKDWKWDEAEESFKRAIELKPGYAAAYQWYANLLAITGRIEEAKAMLRRALEIDPSSHNLIADLGQFYYFSRDYEKAAELCQKALDIYPDFKFAYYYLRDIYLKQGKYEESLDMELKASYVEDRNSYRLKARLVTGKEQLQRVGGWETYVKMKLAEHNHDKHLDSYLPLARYYLLRGDKKQALDWLEEAVKQRTFILAFLGVDPFYDDLRSEPRFQDILKRMKLAR